MFITNNQAQDNQEFKFLVMAKAPLDQKLLEDFLTSTFSCRVRGAANSEATIAISNNQRFDLIIINLGSPEMDGLTAVKTIRQGGVNQRTPIVATSGLPDAENILSKVGVNIFLAKPFRPLELEMIIRRFVRR